MKVYRLINLLYLLSMKTNFKQLLLACSIGDGYISAKGTFKITHCISQKEYLEYKASLFGCKLKYKLNNGYDSFYIQKGVFNEKYEGKAIRNLLYNNNGSKYFSSEVVELLDKFCIAILYCDDGSLIPMKRNGKIHAYKCTISIYGTKDECIRLSKKIFDLFDVKFNINRDKGKYLLKCGTREAKKFLPQIKSLLPKLECFSNNKLLNSFVEEEISTSSKRETPEMEKI